MAAIDIGTAFVAGDAIVASAMNTRFTGIKTWADGDPTISATTNTTTIAGLLTVTEALTASSTSQFNGTVTLGVNDTGVDLICYGASDGAYMKWDQTTDDLQLVGAAGLDIAGDIDVDGTTNLDDVDIDGAVQIDGTVTVGASDLGFDVKFWGDTAAKYMLWDTSEDRLDATGDIRAQATGSYPVVIGVGNPSVTPNGNNLAIGTGALAVVTGGDNIAIGYNAMNDTTTSGWNTAIGHGAMALTTTHSGAPSYAQYNVCVGYESLYNMVNGSGGNVGMGFKAGRGITTGVNNTYIGMQSGDTGIGGHTNTAVGYNTTRNISTGYYNVAVGGHAGISLTEGYNDVFLGYLAGNTTTTADDCVAIGTQALYLNVAGDDNVAIGFQALYNAVNITNTAVGSYAGHWTSSGHSNTFLGYYAGNAVSPFTGDNNTCLGNSSGPAAVDSDNSVTLGNSSISSLRCQVQSISELSDERDKTDIEDLDMGLDFIRRLRPRRYVWNMRDGGKVGIEETGFVAQELQQAQSDEGNTIPNLILDENPDKLEAAIGTLIPPLVKAIQELAEKVEAMA